MLIPAHIEEAIVQHARFTYPEEACGLIAMDGAGIRFAYALTNIDRSPYRYTLDPNEHFRAMRHAERNGWELGGVFHSHPASAAYPSSTDIAQALERSWLYVVVGLAELDAPEVRAFQLGDGAISEVELVRPPLGRGGWAA